MTSKPFPLIACTVLLAAIAFLPLSAAADARVALDRFLKGLETYSAEFTQTLTDETDFVLQEAEGRFSIGLPDRLRWEVDAPFEQQIVADGEYLWIHDPELRQATVRPVDTALDATPLALLTQPYRLDEHFVVAEEEVAEGWRLVLRPRAPDADFTQLKVDLGPEDELLGLAFMDVFGQRTEIHLQEAQRNPVLAPGEFEFTPPPGTDVYRP